MLCLELKLLFVFFFTFKSGVLTNERLFKGLDEKMLSLLKPLSEISLRLRTREESLNKFLQFFLNQTACPVKVFLNLSNDMELNRNNVLLTNLSEMAGIIEFFSTREGTQFFIIEGRFEQNALIDTATSIWNRTGIFKNYFVTSNNIYFYNPFALSALGKYGAFQIVKNGKEFETIFQNLNGYSLRTYIFRSVYVNLVFDKLTKKVEKAEGADANVAYSIEKAINCNLVLEEPDNAFFGHHLDNGSYDGAIGRAIRYEADLFLTGFFVKDYYTRDIEFSVTVYTDKLCCYVSKAKRIPQSILPLFAVKVDMWIGFLAAAFVWAVFWILIRKLNLYVNRKRGVTIPKQLTKYDWPYLRILCDTWVIWVRASICQYPPFSSEKVFVVTVCLVSVIFGAIFESSLSTVYINPLYYNDINTMQELDESQLKILTKHAAIKDDLFYGTTSEMYKRLDSKFLYVTNQKGSLIDIMSKKGGFASVTRASSLILDDISYILTKKIHQIPECPKRYRIAYVFPKESPYKERVNDLLLRFLNAGLITHWINTMLHKARIGILQAPEVLQIMGVHTWKVLTIEDLQLAFYVVILGSLISTIVLITEIYIAKRSRQQFK